MKTIYRILVVCILLQSCSTKDCIELEDNEPVVPCEGVFYSSRFTNAGTGVESLHFDSFQQPVPTIFSSNEIEQKTVTIDPDNIFSLNFSTFDKMNNRYAFFYLWDDSIADNTLYLADTNTSTTAALNVQQDYAAPVFLNGDLYSINTQTDLTDLFYEILFIDQTTGLGSVIFSDNAIIDGLFANGFVSSATNGTDTIYFLGIKTLIAYNVVSNTSQVFDIDIQYDIDISTALSGLEYRTANSQLIAIHHKLNSPNDINEVVSINPTNGNYVSLYDLQDNIGSVSVGLELLTNSTTYSSCNDTYYITELDLSEVQPIENEIMSIDLSNLDLTKSVTEDFIYGITLDEDE
jgi:hypothetical protein